jgi:hypothetical protein
MRDLTWLPDGSGLAFVEERHLATALVVLSPSGEEAARFDLTDGVPNELVVAPDGSALAWGIMGTSILRVQPLAGGEAQTYQETPNAYVSWRPILLDH